MASAFGVDKGLDKYSHNDSPNSSRHSGRSLTSGYVNAIDHSSPHIAGQLRPPASPTIIEQTQNPVTAIGTSFGLVDTCQQPEINDRSDSDHDMEDGDMGVVRCMTPFLVRGKDAPSSPDLVLEPSEVVGGINKHGNRFRRTHYFDGTNSYQYDNRDGTHYEKHRDGSADFHSTRGFTKHYPPPLTDKPVGSKRYDRREVRDRLQGYLVATRKAPAIGQEDIQQLERSNFGKNRADEGPRSERRCNPQQTASRRPWSSRRSAKHKSNSRVQDSTREPHAFQSRQHSRTPER